MASFSSSKICVLLIDSDVKSLLHTAHFLHSCSCAVIPVGDATTALQKLSKEKDSIDFVMAETLTPAMDVFALLKITNDLKLRMILTCPEKDPIMAVIGLERGAFMVLEKPLSRQTIETLWQHVRREHILKMQAIMTPSPTPPPTLLFDDIWSCQSGDPRGKAPLEDSESCGCKRKKPRNEGVLKVQENRKFMDAATALGEGRRYEKNIADLMNDLGLTRVQVLSHLQKLRREWRPSSSSQSHALKRFGAMRLPVNMPQYRPYAPNVAAPRGASSSEGPRPGFLMRSQITASHLANVLNELQFGPPLDFAKRSEIPPILNGMHFGPPQGFPKFNEFPPAIANSMQRNAANGSGLPGLNEGGSFPTTLPRIVSLANPNSTVRDSHENYPKPEPQSDDDDDDADVDDDEDDDDGACSESSSDPNSTPHRYVPGGSNGKDVKREP